MDTGCIGQKLKGYGLLKPLPLSTGQNILAHFFVIFARKYPYAINLRGCLIEINYNSE